MKIPLAVLTTLASASALSVSTSDLGGDSFTGDILTKKSTLYVPYGPNLDTSQPWQGYGFGMGATEHIAYDYKEKYIYSQSEAPGGYITVVDFSTLPGTVTEYSFESNQVNTDVRDIVVCPETGLLFLTLNDLDTVQIYETVKRGSPKVPVRVGEISGGNAPDAMKLSNDCSVLAIANQNEDANGLDVGSLTLVTGDFRNNPTIRSVDLGVFNEATLIANKVHLPVTFNSLSYWNIQLGLGAEAVLANWSPDFALDPEFIAFNNEGTEIYLNLQENSAIARIDVATATTTSIQGLGLKDMTSTNIDLVKDGECNFQQVGCLYLNRNPDGIATVEVDGIYYILATEEGSDFDYNDDFGEKFDSNDFFKNGTVAFPGFTMGPGIAECAVNFDSICQGSGATWCSDFEMTVGSSGINYDVPTAPVIEKIVGIGGRGLSIWEVPSDTQAPLGNVWESGSAFEEETCSKYPWANNAVMDEEFAPVGGARWIIFNDDDDRGDINDRNEECQVGATPKACPMGQTVDEKAQEDGLAVEAVAVGVACSRLVMVGCGENNGVCLLYDITNIRAPELIKTFHLSPISETKNPEDSYQVDLGDIDSETIVFIPADQSPTEKAGILFAGAISGTLSFYEFECTSALDTSSSNKVGGLIGGIIAGFVALLVLA